jgi:hypothetical protein
LNAVEVEGDIIHLLGTAKAPKTGDEVVVPLEVDIWVSQVDYHLQRATATVMIDEPSASSRTYAMEILVLQHNQDVALPTP